MKKITEVAGFEVGDVVELAKFRNSISDNPIHDIVDWIESGSHTIIVDMIYDYGEDIEISDDDIGMGCELEILNDSEMLQELKKYVAETERLYELCHDSKNKDKEGFWEAHEKYHYLVTEGEYEILNKIQCKIIAFKSI